MSVAIANSEEKVPDVSGAPHRRSSCECQQSRPKRHTPPRTSTRCNSMSQGAGHHTMIAAASVFASTVVASLSTSSVGTSPVNDKVDHTAVLSFSGHPFDREHTMRGVTRSACLAVFAGLGSEQGVVSSPPVSLNSNDALVSSPLSSCSSEPAMTEVEIEFGCSSDSSAKSNHSLTDTNSFSSKQQHQLDSRRSGVESNREAAHLDHNLAETASHVTGSTTVDAVNPLCEHPVEHLGDFTSLTDSTAAAAALGAQSSRNCHTTESENVAAPTYSRSRKSDITSEPGDVTSDQGAGSQVNSPNSTNLGLVSEQGHIQSQGMTPSSRAVTSTRSRSRKSEPASEAGSVASAVGSVADRQLENAEIASQQQGGGSSQVVSPTSQGDAPTRSRSRKSNLVSETVTSHLGSTASQGTEEPVASRHSRSPVSDVVSETGEIASQQLGGGSPQVVSPTSQEGAPTRSRSRKSDIVSETGSVASQVRSAVSQGVVPCSQHEPASGSYTRSAVSDVVSETGEIASQQQGGSSQVVSATSQGVVSRSSGSREPSVASEAGDVASQLGATSQVVNPTSQHVASTRSRSRGSILSETGDATSTVGSTSRHLEVVSEGGNLTPQQGSVGCLEVAPTHSRSRNSVFSSSVGDFASQQPGGQSQSVLSRVGSETEQQITSQQGAVASSGAVASHVGSRAVESGTFGSREGVHSAPASERVQSQGGGDVASPVTSGRGAVSQRVQSQGDGDVASPITSRRGAVSDRIQSHVSSRGGVVPSRGAQGVASEGFQAQGSQSRGAQGTDSQNNSEGGYVEPAAASGILQNAAVFSSQSTEGQAQAASNSVGAGELPPADANVSSVGGQAVSSQSQSRAPALVAVVVPGRPLMVPPPSPASSRADPVAVTSAESQTQSSSETHVNSAYSSVLQQSQTESSHSAVPSTAVPSAADAAKRIQKARKIKQLLKQSQKNQARLNSMVKANEKRLAKKLKAVKRRRARRTQRKDEGEQLFSQNLQAERKGKKVTVLYRNRPSRSKVPHMTVQVKNDKLAVRKVGKPCPVVVRVGGGSRSAVPPATA